MINLSRIYLWMTVPFVIAIAGFYFSYWSRFAQAPFHQHLHGLTATLWYVMMIVQPWLYSRGNLALHRKIGFFALFLAGGVVFSALQVIGHNLTNDRLNPVLKYGLTWGDFLFLTGFTHAVMMGVLKSKSPDVHARYMIASAFWALLPALGRLIYFPIVIAYGAPPPVSFLQVLYGSVAIVLVVLTALMVSDYRAERRVYASYALVAGVTLTFGLGVGYMGEAQWWIAFCNTLLRSG